jgi:multidrug efflux pump subunit AcrB
MSKRTFWIGMSIMTVVLGMLIFLNIWMEREPEPDVSFRMANSRIEWTGAGYNGIYAK